MVHSEPIMRTCDSNTTTAAKNLPLTSFEKTTFELTLVNS